jgi:hypothetical protein
MTKQSSLPSGRLLAVMAAAGLKALSSPPERPSQAQLPRAIRQGECHFQQTAHFGDRQFGQEGFGPPFFSVAVWRTEANQV